jgi:hypothetical protein
MHRLRMRSRTEVTSEMLSDMRQQLSDFELRADKLGRRL